MNPYMAYEAVITKISAKTSRIVDEKKFEKLMECSSVDQVTENLGADFGLKEIIDRAKSHDLHRDDLETLLKRYEVKEIENILHYFAGPYKDFIQVFLMEFEISDLVMILRKIAKGETLDGIENHFIHSEKYSSLPYNKLVNSRTVLQFMDNLKNTSYYEVLKTVTDDDVVKREFHIEMKLQLLFYKTLINKASNLMAADRRAADEIIGLNIDLLNVQWIYRAKKYYKISPEEMLIYSLQGGRKLSFGRLKKLCYLTSIDEIQKLSNLYLKYNIFDGKNDTDLERNINKYMYEIIKDRKFNGTIGTVILYIYLLNIIVKQLVTITEGIRYKLPKERIKQFLVRL